MIVVQVKIDDDSSGGNNDNISNTATTSTTTINDHNIDNSKCNDNKDTINISTTIIIITATTTNDCATLMKALLIDKVNEECSVFRGSQCGGEIVEDILGMYFAEYVAVMSLVAQTVSPELDELEHLRQKSILVFGITKKRP